MGPRRRILIAGALLGLWMHAHAALPPQYVGLWATADSVFQNENLQGGTALYLDADGSGAMVVAPLPVKKCGEIICTPVVGIRVQASLQPADASTLQVVLQSSLAASPLVFAIDPDQEGLTLRSSAAKGLRLIHKVSVLSPEIRTALHGYADTRPGPISSASAPRSNAPQ